MRDFLEPLRSVSDIGNRGWSWRLTTMDC